MSFLNFLVNQIFRQPPLFLGIVALVGLLFQKKSGSEVVKGTSKTIIGVIVLMKAVDIIVASIDPLSKAFTKLYAIPSTNAVKPIGFTNFVGQYGSTIGLVMVLAFAINLIVAKFTRFKNIFLTGHVFFWMAFLFVAIGIEGSLSGTKLIVFATALLSFYIIVTPALIRPFVKQVTGDDSFTIGHTTVGLSLIGALLGKWFGNKEKSMEDVKIPQSLEFLRETTITTGLVMFIVYIVVGFMVGHSVRVEAFGAANADSASLIVYAIMQGLTFGAGLTVLLTGVRLMLGEIIPAFKGIADKLIPNAIPALDCPMIFPYAPNSVLVGFIISMISSIIAIVVLASTGNITSAVIPLTVACFFDVGPAAVFANATGGRRGVIIASIVCGALLIVFEAMSIPLLQNTVSDFVQAFGGNDFSIWPVIVRNIMKLFGMS
ncbi:PTS ascorbate transporter subunit IIC [Clostridium oceanicum]|uniref:Ascorbate-specific PTS system EIIC component n=1 Tax=Clostridium oceanicum TaxID=1543 RepID=A0ABN1JLX8_9CLOT